MDWLHYIDNEVPWGAGWPPSHWGEWTTGNALSPNQIIQSPDAAFP